MTLLCAAALVQAAVLVVLEYDSAWKDNAALALYICAAAWGIGDSVANTVMYSIIGGYVLLPLAWLAG